MVCTLKHLSLCPEMEALYLFNPENDMALACGDPYYMAPASARRMAAELSVLPAWYAEQGRNCMAGFCSAYENNGKTIFFAAFGQLDFRIPPHL